MVLDILETQAWLERCLCKLKSTRILHVLLEYIIWPKRFSGEHLARVCVCSWKIRPYLCVAAWTLTNATRVGQSKKYICDQLPLCLDQTDCMRQCTWGFTGWPGKCDMLTHPFFYNMKMTRSVGSEQQHKLGRLIHSLLSQHFWFCVRVGSHYSDFRSAPRLWVAASHQHRGSSNKLLSPWWPKSIKFHSLFQCSND